MPSLVHEMRDGPSSDPVLPDPLALPNRDDGPAVRVELDKADGEPDPTAGLPPVHADADTPPAQKAKPSGTQLAALTPPDKPVWQQNAVRAPDTNGKPLIAIVIDDVGIDQKRSRRSIELPAPLTLSFLPYGYHLKDLSKRAREVGHELLVHVPMEPLNADADPGPNALLTTLSETEIRDRLRWNLEQFSGYVGISNHMGSKFTAWSDGMRLVMEELGDQGLLFLDSWTTNDSQGIAQARELGIPSVARDVFIDHDIDVEAIEKSLIRLERIALRRGYAIGIGHPYDLTTEALEKWLPRAQARGFAIVPVSTVIRHMGRSSETVVSGGADRDAIAVPTEKRTSP